jgi:hypothetical protein
MIRSPKVIRTRVKPEQVQQVQEAPMSAPTHPAEPSLELEHDAINMVKNRLRSRHPDMPTERIDTTVETVYHHFDQSAVRAFVPVLVEHEARTELGDY